MGDARHGTVARTIPVSGVIQSLTLTPNNLVVAVSLTDVSVAEVDTGDVRLAFEPCPQGMLNGAALSLRFAVVLSYGRDGVVRAWDLAGNADDVQEVTRATLTHAGQSAVSVRTATGRVALVLATAGGLTLLSLHGSRGTERR